MGHQIDEHLQKNSTGYTTESGILNSLLGTFHDICKHRHAVHAEPVTFPFLSIATRHLNVYVSEQKLVRRKYTATLPFLGSHFLTFWVSPILFLTVTSQCSRIQVYSHADKVLCDLGHVSPNLHKESESRL